MASNDDGKEKIITLKLVLQVLGAVLLSVVFLGISALLIFAPHSYFIANAYAFSYAFITLAVVNGAVTFLFIFKMRTLGLIYMFSSAIGLMIIADSNYYRGISDPEVLTYFVFVIIAAFYIEFKKKPPPLDSP
jgi:hypothetical protein